MFYFLTARSPIVILYFFRVLVLHDMDSNGPEWALMDPNEF